MEAEAGLPSRWSIVLLVLLGVIVLGWIGWGWIESRAPSSPQQTKDIPGPTINKQPVTFANRTFDPAAPPADMPPLPAGEVAECDSNFQSDARVGGQSRQTDATHAIVTITQVSVTLQLAITIWVPTEATQHVMEHEEGHRQISEYYYQTADKVAERVAAPYIGKQVAISGADLQAEFRKLLQQMGADITDEYSKELNPEPAQLRYDDITDHSRNEVVAQDGAAQALNGITP
jgi:hypothetical protein